MNEKEPIEKLIISYEEAVDNFQKKFKKEKKERALKELREYLQNK